MFFLLRMAFWLSVVCVLLPSSATKSTSPNAQIDADRRPQHWPAPPWSDVRGFCDRQPTLARSAARWWSRSATEPSRRPHAVRIHQPKLNEEVGRPPKRLRPSWSGFDDPAKHADGR